MNLVYLTTNLINNKQYIGSHCTNNINDGYIGSGNLINSAIKKYGKESFKREILMECNTSEEVRLLEELYIKKYNTLSPSGYNLHPQGGMLKGGFISKEHKKKISDSLRGKKRDPKIGKKIRDTRIKNNSYILTKEIKEKIRNGNLGKVRSEEQRKNMSKGQKGKQLSEKHKEQLRKNGRKNKGKKHTAESRKNMSMAHIGIKQKRKQCLYCNQSIPVNIYPRYHGEKCKNNIN